MSISALTVLLALALTSSASACTITTQVAVIGGTVCGATASVGARRSAPLNVTWIVAGQRLGGMTSGGLGGMDAGMAVGGVAKELFSQLGHNFEPHTAELAVETLLSTAEVTVHRGAGELLSVQTEGSPPSDKRRIMAATFSSGLMVCANVWVDCSYEGDLLRLSGTDFAVGRESAAEFNESMAGSDDKHAAAAAATPSFFAPTVSPWVDESNTTLLPTIVGVLNGSAGSSDDWVMSYCFRLCLTNNASNHPVKISAPAGYDRSMLELLRRELQWATSQNMSLSMDDLFLIRHLPNGKMDLNSGQFSEAGLSPVSHRHGGYFPFSTDMPSLQKGWPLGNASERDAIFQAHKWWTQALLYFLGNDPELREWQPGLVAEVGSWGLAGDEFVDTDNWPPQLYVRESVRMKGAKILTQRDVFGDGHGGGPGTGHLPPEPVQTSVGLSKWLIDIHAVKRVAVQMDGEWRVANAGGRDTGRSHWGPSKLIEVPYEVLTPRQNDTSNLLVPVCISSSHVGFSAYRLEPQYAVFGHSAGVAAAIAAQYGVSVQDVDVVGMLQPMLVAQGQLLNSSALDSVSPASSVTSQLMV